jgi:hypothetical protein
MHSLLKSVPITILFFSCFHFSSEAQTHYVLAQPNLNLRNVNDRSEVVAKLPYGCSVEPTGRTYESTEISNLSGTWREVMWKDEVGNSIKGVLFDAFIFPFNAPLWGSKSDGEDEPLRDYAINNGVEWKFCEANEGSTSTIYFESTLGQALRFFRMWVEHSFEPYVQSGHLRETVQKELKQELSRSWNGGSTLDVGPSMEMEYIMLIVSLERMDDTEEGRSVFKIEINEFLD